MNCLGLIELSDPVSFDPVGPVTAVFYDDKNNQVFSVRSGGATGIVVKSPGKAGRTFVLEDKGPILSIKLNPDNKILAIQRKKTSLDLYNVDKSGQIDPVEYSLTNRNKLAPIIGVIWRSEEELVTISDCGLDVYTVVPARKIVKYVRSSGMTISWFSSCPVSNLLLTSAKLETSSLQIWAVRNSSIIKLPALELGTLLVKEKDVALINVYRESYICVSVVEDETVTGIRLYSTLNDNITLLHQLKVNIQGTVSLQVLDNLILVHSLHNSSTQIFDIACKSESASLAAAVDHQPILPTTSITGKSSCVPMKYSPTWVLFLPNILVDAREGQMYTLNTRLKRAEARDDVALARFYLNRSGGKPQLLQHLKDCLLKESVGLRSFASIFHHLILSYHLHQGLGEAPPTLVAAGQKPIQPAVVLDQSELYTAVLAPAEKEGVCLTRLQGILVELLLCLATFKLTPRQFITEMFINLAVKTQQYYQLHQFIQYGVITDSKHIACLLLSLESVYPPASQIALDMMARMGNAVEELIEICLAEGKVVPAINLARDTGLVDTVSARKYLDAAKSLDSLTFFNVFSFFEERNLRLRGTPRFAADENCEEYIQHFKQLFVK